MEDRVRSADTPAPHTGKNSPPIPAHACQFPNPVMIINCDGWFVRGVALMVGKYVIPVVATLLLTGCGFLSLGQPNLASDDPAQKIPAIKSAARHHDSSAIPLLIKALSSQDSAIRFYAIYALHKITGHEFGYVYYASESRRNFAIARWKKWLAAQHSMHIHLPVANIGFVAPTSAILGGPS